MATVPEAWVDLAACGAQAYHCFVCARRVALAIWAICISVGLWLCTAVYRCITTMTTEARRGTGVMRRDADATSVHSISTGS